MATDEYFDLDKKIALVEKDVSQIDKLCTRLAESVEKLHEVNVNLNRIIVIHEEKHDQHEKAEQKLESEIKDLRARITVVNQELHDRIDEVERHITAKIDALRRDLIDTRAREKSKITDIVREIDRYKWMAVGAAMAIGWAIGNLNLSSISNLLK